MIDTFSLFVFTSPIKSKTVKEVQSAFMEIFKENNDVVPERLETDQGTVSMNCH